MRLRRKKLRNSGRAREAHDLAVDCAVQITVNFCVDMRVVQHTLVNSIGDMCWRPKAQGT